jgi:hypothetical protein
MIHQNLGGDIPDLDADRFFEEMRRYWFFRFGAREDLAGINPIFTPALRMAPTGFNWIA